MTMNLELNGSAYFIKHKTKMKTVPTIGFEYEVPSVSERYSRSFIDSWGNTSWCDRNGFTTHVECGGIEYCSPVGNTVSQARLAAKTLLKYLKNKGWVDKPERTHHSCGIHVTVSSPKNKTVVESAALFALIAVFLNQNQNDPFVWELSGREGCGSSIYHGQARTTGGNGCFIRGLDFRTAWDRDELYVRNSSVRWQRFRGKGGAYEVRIFGARPEVLLPAIDFTHSLYKFLEPKSHNLLNTNQVLDNLPSWSAYREWVMSQPGYSALKSYAKWELIDA